MAESRLDPYFCAEMDKPSPWLFIEKNPELLYLAWRENVTALYFCTGVYLPKTLPKRQLSCLTAKVSSHHGSLKPVRIKPASV